MTTNPEEPTVVYLVECGVYSDTYTDGIYWTLEAAMEGQPGTFTAQGEGYWCNDLDFSQYVEIRCIEVEGTRPVAAPDTEGRGRA